MIAARRRAINAALSDASILLAAAESHAIEIGDLSLAADIKAIAVRDLRIALVRNQHAADSGRSQVLA